MSNRIYLCLAHMSEDGWEKKYIKEAFDTNWVVPLGPNVDGFEKDLRRYVCRVSDSQPMQDRENVALSSAQDREDVALSSAIDRQVVALSSGTAAVHLGLLACGVRPGDEVLVQSFTFCASTHPVRYLGATPVMIDSERETWNMDPALLEKAIVDRMAVTGRKPKAIVVVHLYGMPAKIDEIMAVADRYDIPVLEDAAEGFGSRYRGRVVGTFGRYGVLSFNGNKIITTSGGGALICPDAESRDRVMWYATQAREAYPYYHHEAVGYNYRLSNICAGIGRGQMHVLDEHIARHRHIAAMYRDGFAGVDGITFHDELPFMESNFWLSTILLDPCLHVRGEQQAYGQPVSGAVGGAAGLVHGGGPLHTGCEPNRNVEAMRLALDQAGIESRPLWKPMHCQPVYRDVPAYVNGVSEDLFRRGLCLPSGPLVTDADVERIIGTIRETLTAEP